MQDKSGGKEGIEPSHPASQTGVLTIILQTPCVAPGRIDRPPSVSKTDVLASIRDGSDLSDIDVGDIL